jgi:hypothetical protein
MALTVKVDHPDYSEGTEFGINGLGLFKNGEAREITEEEERAYASYAQVGAGDMLKQSDYLEVSGTPIVTDLEEVLGKDVSSLPSPDPTAMNIDPTTGEVFEHANLNGISTDPENVPTEEEEEAVVAPKTINTTSSSSDTPKDDTGGDN